VEVRLATLEDAEEGSRVLRRSIIELCQADHGAEPDAIAAWTANKTPAEWRNWLARPGVYLYVADEDGRILGVGSATQDGRVLLNYVSPDARWRGVSKALLARMEGDMGIWGCARCDLQSSATAHAFYLAQGYRDLPGDGGRRMWKPLVAVDGRGGGR
jgi:GNAT superfamily N-acetyltransferase